MMSCDRYRELMMGALDGELRPEEELRLQEHLAACGACRAELESFSRLQEVAESMNLVMPEDRFWLGYWESVYRRLERGIGWVLLSAGVVLLTLFGGWHLLQNFFLDPEVPAVLRMGCGIVGAGLVVLLVSVFRERLFADRHERYKDVRR